MPRTTSPKDCRIETLTRQLESRTNLMRMVIHDLKGPLGSIMANLDLLMSRISGEEERELLETALQGGSDLLAIINTLLEIGKMEREKLDLNLSVINLAGMFEATAAKLKSLTGQKNITLETVCRSSTSSVAVDAALLERILFNLVTNAVRHTQEGGTITLRTEDGKTNDTVLLAVSDTGIGIPGEFHETIFDLYAQIPAPGRTSTGSGKREGTGENTDGRGRRRVVHAGIGLAFCKLAAQQHGGSIWVESEVGKGSTFFISLPTNLIPSGSGLV